MVLSDADTSASGAATIAAITHIPYKKRRDMRGVALTDASPTILMDTSTYDVPTAGTHANAEENRRQVVSFSCFSTRLGLDFSVRADPAMPFLSSCP